MLNLDFECILRQLCNGFPLLLFQKTWRRCLILKVYSSFFFNVALNAPFIIITKTTNFIHT